MASRSKRTRGASSSNPVFVHREFSYLSFTEEEDLNRFDSDFNKRSIISPRFSTLDYLLNEAPNGTFHILNNANISTFVLKTHEYYTPSFVKAFYSNLKRKDEDDVLYTTINGREILLTEELIHSLTELPMENPPMDEEEEEEEEFNEEVFLNTIFNGPIVRTRNGRPTIHGMRDNIRVIFYILTNILRPRKFTHTIMTLDDSKLLNSIVNNTPMNWCRIVLDHMSEATKPKKWLPYATLIMDILESANINTNFEPKKKCNKHGEISVTTFPDIVRPIRARQESPEEEEVSLQTISAQLNSLTTIAQENQRDVRRANRSLQNMRNELHGYFDSINYAYSRDEVEEDDDGGNNAPSN